SAFNTIIPQQLIHKLNLLGLNTPCRPQHLEHYHTKHSPLLFTLLTHDCTAKFSSNHIIKFADDTTVVGLISNNDETHYREEVAQLAKWCGANNLSLNVGKTKEVVMDFRRNSVAHPPLTIDSSTIPGGAHYGGSHLDHQRHIAQQEGPTAPPLSPLAEKG
ncbi:hypothetical protein M9458_000463, partial [Cirrhinus mrigala]